MSKRRISLRLSDNEIAVVGSLDQWKHLVVVYEGLADMYPEDWDLWQESAAWVREWIEKTSIKTGDEDEW